MKKHSIEIFSLFLILFLLLGSLMIPVNAASSPIVNNGIYYIKNQRTGKYLTAASASSGANIYQANFTGGSLQKFKLVKTTTTGTAYYNIVSAANTSLRLDVVNASDASGADIKLFVENPSYASAQAFRLVQTVNASTINSYKIMPQLSSTNVLSIKSASLLSGANVQLGTSSSSATYQDWVFERVSALEIYNVTPINIYKQQTSTTCGSACAKMILAKHGVSVTEDAIKNYASQINDIEYGYTYVWALTDAINHFLQQNNISARYTYESYAGMGVDIFTIVVGLSVENNIPIQLPIKNNTGTNTGLPYTTAGHYLVICGAKSNTSGENMYICVADPYMNSAGTSKAGVWEIPIAELYAFSNNHSGYIITLES